MKAILGDFVRRIGGMLLAPRATIDTAIDERGRGSFATMVVLCLLTATALSFPSLMRSTLFAVDVSASAGLMMLVNVLLGQLLLPLCAALLAGLLLSLTGRRKQHPRVSRSTMSDSARCAPYQRRQRYYWSALAIACLAPVCPAG